MSIYVAGVDPGLKHIGAAIVDVSSLADIGKHRVIWAETHKDVDPIAKIFAHFKPILVGIEEPFVGRNIRAYGDTKEMIGLILCKLSQQRVISSDHPLVRTSPAAGNTVLGLDRGVPKTDKAKRDRANLVFFTNLVGGIKDGHQASAAAAAVVAWELFVKEIRKTDDTS